MVSIPSMMRGRMLEASTRRTSCTISMPMKSFFVCSQKNTITSSISGGRWGSASGSLVLSMNATRSSTTAMRIEPTGFSKISCLRAWQ